MDCATFAAELAELLGDAHRDDHPVRTARLEALRRHAEDCGACHGAGSLVALARLPAGCRDVANDPGPEYWTAFERAVSARLDAAQRSRRHARRLGAFAAAALVVAALGGGIAWMLRGQAPATGDDDAAIADALGPEAAWDDFADEPASGSPELFPPIEGLDERARESLLRWLVEEEARFEPGPGGTA